MTFRISAKQPELLNIVNACSVLVDEATFEVSAESMKFKGMDPSHIALVNIEYPASSFDEYGVDAPQTFGVRVTELQKICGERRSTTMRRGNRLDSWKEDGAPVANNL